MFLYARGEVVVYYDVRGNGTWCGSHPCCICPVPNKLGIFLFVSIPNPIKTHVMALDMRCLTVSLMMPEAVELSVCMGIGPCGCPISSSEVQVPILLWR